MESTRHELENVPNFEAEVIPDVGHYLFFEAPAALRQLLSEFYKRHESRLVEQGA
jgi:pimeloyl-ACP methyl ester carboxylesterase